MRRIVNILKFINEHGSVLLLIFAILAIGLWLLVRYLKNQNLTDSRKSLIITIYSFSTILILLFFLRFWPPYGKTELLIAQGGGGGGVELNFGNTDRGKGDDYLSETLEVNMKEVASQPVESTPDEILTQDNVGAEVPTPVKVKNKPKDKTPTETKPVETPKIPVKKTNSALSNMIKGNKKGGDGNSSTSGNQGSAGGNTNANGYYGSGGSGGGTGGGNGTGNGTGSGAGSGSGSGGGNGSGNGTGANYILTGRKRNFEPALGNNCNTYGKVVIEITVDKTGKTLKAVNGKGTTGDACLIQQAKQLALNTRWDASNTAAEKQVGTITYNFKN